MRAQLLCGALLASVQLLAAEQLLAAAPAASKEAPEVSLSKVVDGRGNVIALVAGARTGRRAGRAAPLVSVLLVRGLLRDDIHLRQALPPEGSASVVRVSEAWVGGHAPLRLVRPSQRDRVVATSPAGEFRWYEPDLFSATVRCNLFRLAEATDPDLLRAAVEWGELRESVDVRPGEGGDEVLLDLRAVAGWKPRPSPPVRRLLPLPDDDPAAEPLRRALLEALASRDITAP